MRKNIARCPLGEGDWSAGLRGWNIKSSQEVHASKSLPPESDGHLLQLNDVGVGRGPRGVELTTQLHGLQIALGQLHLKQCLATTDALELILHR